MWLFDPDGTVLEGPDGPVSHLICSGVYDRSTGLIYQNGRYFDPSLGIWLALTPLMVLQAWKKKRHEWHSWVLILCLGLFAVTMLSGFVSPPQTLESPFKICIAGGGWGSPGGGGYGPPWGSSAGSPPLGRPPGLPRPPQEPPLAPPAADGDGHNEIARITRQEIESAGGTMEAYLRREEDAALLTRVAMAESSLNRDDRIYVMWIIRLRMEVAFMNNQATQGSKTTLQEEVFGSGQFSTISEILRVTNPRSAALGPHSDPLSCGGHLNSAIYPCDTSGLDGVDPNPDASDAVALNEWYYTYHRAHWILALPMAGFKAEFPAALRGFDSFFAYPHPTRPSTRFFENGNHFFSQTENDTHWLWEPQGEN